MTPMIMTLSLDLPESDQGGQAEHAEYWLKKTIFHPTTVTVNTGKCYSSSKSRN